MSMPARRTKNAVQVIARRFQSSRISNAQNAFISQTQSAVESPALTSLRSRNPLSGRDIAIKDNICTVDFPTTCASHILHHFQSPYDATVIERLRAHGAVICGKTNMDEFGMGSHSSHSIFGAVENLSSAGEVRSAGGSSGGSAIAVAEGQCWAAIGTDTGGSVRLPAAYTGVFGFKPSYGLISRYGVIAYANSLDTVGILADGTHKIRSVFRAISVYDYKDPTSLSEKSRERIAASCARSIMSSNDGLKIGVPIDYNIADLDPNIRRAWTLALEALQTHSHSVTQVAVPATKHALSAYYILAPAEASSNLARFDGVRYGTRSEGSDAEGGTLYSKTREDGLGPEVKRRILLGSYTLSSEAIDNYFMKAQKIRRLVQKEFDSVFSMKNPLHDHADYESEVDTRSGSVDVLICPTAPNMPPKLSDVKALGAVESYMTDVFTVPASLAGLPAISVPLDIDGLGSVGIQIIGQFGADEQVLAVAQLFEEWGMTARCTADSTSILEQPAVSASGQDAVPDNGILANPSEQKGFSEELVRSYLNLRRRYGGGIKAVQYHGRAKP